jgi:hypothetical protein
MKNLAKLLVLILALMGALSGAPVYAQTGGGCINSGVNGTPQPGQDCLIESAVYTYAAVSVGLVPAASATDIACITGSATKVVRLLSVKVGGTAGTALSTPVLLTKHISANTGGTAATSLALPVPYRIDSTDAAPTATTTAYTANPTISDAAPGIVDAGISTFGVVTLRGVAQQLCVNLNGVSVSTGSLTISLFWSEQQS